MRINQYLAHYTELSRRAADAAVQQGRVTINGAPATPGAAVDEDDDIVQLDKRTITPAVKTQTIMLHKPAGYVVSRNGQGSKTIYDLLPTSFQHLNPVGRLDKYSSGLLLLTNDGQLAQELTHPSHQKLKVYEITLRQPLQPLHHQMIADLGVQLEDGPSRFELAKQSPEDDRHWQVTMHEGRNRQIRRTFAALGYTVTQLHRTQFGPHHLGTLRVGALAELR